RQTELHRAWEIGNPTRPAPYCVIPFLLPPPKNPCPTRAKKASQAGRRRWANGGPASEAGEFNGRARHNARKTLDFLSRHLRKSCYRSCYLARPSSRSAMLSEDPRQHRTSVTAAQPEVETSILCEPLGWSRHRNRHYLDSDTRGKRPRVASPVVTLAEGMCLRER